MIDVESEVFSTVAMAVRTQHPNAFVTGEEVATPPRFPCVVLREMDNSTYQRTLDSSSAENHAQLMYQVDVYSNLAIGKKSQCREIVALVDTAMQSLGFVRIGSGPMEIPSAHKTIYRMVARYRGTISKDFMMYRR